MQEKSLSSGRGDELGESGGHPFDRALQLEAIGPGEWRGRTSEAYNNFVGPFGGLTAGQAVQAVRLHPHRLGEPVAFTFNFAAVIEAGALEIRAKPARTNRSTQHWHIEFCQGTSVVATGTAITAVRRQTWEEDEVKVPSVPEARDLSRSELGGLRWLHRYEMRFVRGGMPREWDGRGDNESASELWLRDDPPRPLDHASVTAYADVFFPRIWMRRAMRVPLGTVTFSVYYHASEEQLARLGSGYVLGAARASGFRGGYFDQSAHLWSERRELLVTSHQLVYFKE